MNPNHYEIVLESMREGLLRFMRDLVTQFPNEVLPYLPRVKTLVKSTFKSSQLNMERYLEVLDTLVLLTTHYGMCTVDVLQDHYFTQDPLPSLLLTLTRLLLTKTDRTVLDLSNRLIKANSVKG
jgi:hypothetical protein